MSDTAKACDIEDCHNPQSWADYCRRHCRVAAAATLETQAARIEELEAALLSAKQHFVADEPLKAFVEICAALEGKKDER